MRTLHSINDFNYMLPLYQTWPFDAGNESPFQLIEFEGNRPPRCADVLKNSPPESSEESDSLLTY